MTEYSSTGRPTSEIAAVLPADLSRFEGGPWKAIRAAVIEVQTRRDAARQARRHADALRDSRRAAESSDRAALAASLKAGTADPGQPAVSAHNTAEAEAIRMLRGQIDARTLSESELAKALRSGRDDLLADAGAAIARQEDAVRTQLAALTDAIAALGELRAIRSFVATEGRSANGAGPAMPLYDLPKGGRSYYSTAQVASALRTALEHRPSDDTQVAA